MMGESSTIIVIREAPDAAWPVWLYDLGGRFLHSSPQELDRFGWIKIYYAGDGTVIGMMAKEG